MEITIGVKHVNRELTLDSDQSTDEIQAAVDKAISDGTSLVLGDDKGRQVVVPSSSLAYVELDAKEQRRVGIGIV
ncbi:DUF3107 domain-containing protein [Georgenia halophila]|uniref:DUF3107 domain-containing protein n=1 Tax=Georgenia halophila TaxID=620889 RepID=A0ABP8L1D0_9MICO